MFLPRRCAGPVPWEVSAGWVRCQEVTGEKNALVPVKGMKDIFVIGRLAPDYVKFQSRLSSWSKIISWWSPWRGPPFFVRRPERMSCIAAQVVRGLEHLQSRRLLHRDVKPENVLHNSLGQAGWGIGMTWDDGLAPLSTCFSVPAKSRNSGTLG